MRGWWLLLVALTAFAQEPPSLRQQGNDMMSVVYRRADVAARCAEAPNDIIKINLNGPDSAFELSCLRRQQYFELIREFYRMPVVVEACGANPDAEVSVTVFGQQSRVNCRTRAADLESGQR
jgi:hypothetical protein